MAKITIHIPFQFSEGEVKELIIKAVESSKWIDKIFTQDLADDHMSEAENVAEHIIWRKEVQILHKNGDYNMLTLMKLKMGLQDWIHKKIFTEGEHLDLASIDSLSEKDLSEILHLAVFPGVPYAGE